MIQDGRADFSDFADMAARLTVVHRFWVDAAGLPFTRSALDRAPRSEVWTVRVEEWGPPIWDAPKIRVLLFDAQGREVAGRYLDPLGDLVSTLWEMGCAEVRHDGREIPCPPWRSERAKGPEGRMVGRGR